MASPIEINRGWLGHGLILVDPHQIKKSSPWHFLSAHWKNLISDSKKTGGSEFRLRGLINY
jgi:hypothetical protein